MVPKNRGRKIENAIIKWMGARAHLNSGALKESWDADTEEHLLEIKSTKAKQFAIKNDYLHELARDSDLGDKMPVLVVCFDRGGDKVHLDDVYAVIRLSDLDDIPLYLADEIRL